MPVRAALITALLLAAGAAQAQSIGEPLPGQAQSSGKATPWKQGKAAARPCPEYGPGFVRIEGSTACVRLGGSVGVEFGVNSRGRTGSAATGTINLDARDQTSFGQVRTYMQVGGRLDRGYDRYGYPYGYR